MFDPGLDLGLGIFSFAMKGINEIPGKSEQLD